MSAERPARRASWPRRLLVFVVIPLFAAGCHPASHLPPEQLPPPPEARVQLPNAEDSLRFAVIGDSGTGGVGQYEVGQLLASYHEAFPLEFVLMLGDNMYGREGAADYGLKFERPYGALLDAGVKFYASLGNHDERSQRLYEPFNMGGALYYSFAVEEHDARFFALYSDYLDPEQLDWLEEELADSEETWKVAFFHHPIYSSGGFHGPDEELRAALEPLFVKYGVDVVFTGHEHFYERLEPQKGIVYFVNGAAAKLRRGDLRKTGDTAAGYDRELSFMLLELLADGTMRFQAVSTDGEIVDSGALRPREENVLPATADDQPEAEDSQAQ